MCIVSWAANVYVIMSIIVFYAIIGMILGFRIIIWGDIDVYQYMTFCCLTPLLGTSRLCRYKDFFASCCCQEYFGVCAVVGTTYAYAIIYIMLPAIVGSILE